MKKKTALVLTLAMVFSLAPLSAYADTIDRVGGTASHDVLLFQIRLQIQLLRMGL